jgi:hypothetical protein
VRPGSRLAAHGPLSLNGDAKGISPIIAERLSPNKDAFTKAEVLWAPANALTRIALIGVAVDIGECLSVRGHDLEAAV